MTRIDPNSFAQNWLQGMQQGTDTAARRADFQNRYAMQDAAAQRDARDFEFQQQEFANRQAQQTAQADRWQQDFQRSTDNDMWNQMADMRRMGLSDAHLAIAQQRQAEAEAQAQAEGESFRQLNRQMLGAQPSSSMLVPDGMPDFADPIRNLVEHGDYRAQATLFPVLKDQNRRRQLEGIMQMVQSKQLGPNQIADPEMQALIVEAQNSNDPSRIIGRMMDLQRQGQLRNAMMPGTVTGALDGPASPQEAQLGQMVQAVDGNTLDSVARAKIEQANGLGRYAPGKANGRIDPNVDPVGFQQAVAVRLDQLKRLYPNGNPQIMQAAVEREVMTGRSEDLPPVAVTGQNRKLDTASEKALNLAYTTAEKRRAEAVRALQNNPDSAKQAEMEATAQRAEAAAGMAQRRLMEFYTSAAAPQAPADPAAGEDVDQTIDEMIAAGMSDAEIEAALSKR